MAQGSSAHAPGSTPVLVAVDGSASSYQAVAWAAVEATLHGSRLHIFTSMAVPAGYGPAPTETHLESLRAEGQRIVAEATRIARTAAPGKHLLIDTEVGFDPVTPTLLDRSHRVRMLVVGSRGIGAFQRGLLGSVGTALTHHAHCPVAVVHASAAIDPVSAELPVLVGVDGTENSMPAVKLAFEEAARRKVELIALHAWSDSSGSPMPVDGGDAARESAAAVLAESLAGASECHPEVRVRRVVTADRPVRSLLDESAHAQLVVVGSHGRGGFAGMLLGSTSNALLHSVETPMLVVRDR
ncbi:universal stress protein [Nocardia amikacinitolerans]|uniref:universal stress protein n=1 Tax=Nocardia amikacinitolerans TaxID=756689 RepID=UPI0020A36512|nr:universal stress protein [Nocardia amikacinitolerans]MCP2292535.1 Nucleotide-binding universal stress protein, UspA family [Nocardia amikacinitolerans]